MACNPAGRWLTPADTRPALCFLDLSGTTTDELLLVAPQRVASFGLPSDGDGGLQVSSHAVSLGGYFV